MNQDKILELFSLLDKVAIVTGGAGRLGFQHCKILTDAGARVVSFDVSVNGKLDGIAEQVVVDITKRKEVLAAVDDVAVKYGGVDILINNAAFNPKMTPNDNSNADKCWSPHEDYPEELWKMELDIGLNGAMFCTQAVARYMIKQNTGAIVNIASTSAITAPDHRKYKPGRFKSAAYPVVKAALLGLNRSWASYFSRVAPGVRVNVLCPGAVNFGSMEPEFLVKLGERNMLGRSAKPDDYEGAILFLCSRASSFMTAQVLIVDGGQTAW